MAGYLVLARKYRSTTFDEVVGQEPIAQTLTNAIRTGRVAHAYLFTGTRGVGKTTMARILAKALNCLSADEPTTTPCNECEACVAISRGDDVDVVEIDGASNRGIDEIRELRANAIFRPARSRYKIYYIDEVHMLTKEAFNALLKTLEEPPEHVKFIFATTEVEKVPATIVSRCQRFDFRNIPTRMIADHLAAICSKEDVDADSDALFRVARAAAGSMRDALSLLDQLLSAGRSVTEEDVLRVLGTPPDERTLAILAAIADSDTAGALGELDAVLEAGVGLSSIVTALGDMFRNLMVAATCGADSELIELPEASRKQVGELAGRFTMPTLVHALAVLDQAGRNLRGSSVARALAEAALVRLADAEKFVDVASLVERIEQISGQHPAGGGQKKKSPTPVGNAASRSSYVPTGGPKRPIPTDRPTRSEHSAGTARPPDAAVSRPGGSQIGDGPPVAPDHQQNRPETSQADESPATSSTPADIPARPLSSAERMEVQEDPAVQEVLTLFGGKIEDIARVELPAPSDVEDQAESDDDSDNGEIDE